MNVESNIDRQTYVECSMQRFKKPFFRVVGLFLIYFGGIIIRERFFVINIKKYSMYFILHTVRSFSRRYKTRNTVDLTSALNADACANDAPYTLNTGTLKLGGGERTTVVHRLARILWFVWVFLSRFCLL